MRDQLYLLALAFAFRRDHGLQYTNQA